MGDGGRGGSLRVVRAAMGSGDKGEGGWAKEAGEMKGLRTSFLIVSRSS